MPSPLLASGGGGGGGGPATPISLANGGFGVDVSTGLTANYVAFVNGSGAITIGALPAAAVPDLAASKITSGTFDNARVNWASPAALGSSTPAAVTATTISLSSGTGGLSLGSGSGDWSMPTGAGSWAGASGKTLTLTSTAAAISINASSTGSILTLNGTLGVRLRYGGTDYMDVGNTSAGKVTLAGGVDLVSGGLISDIDWSASSGAFTAPTGPFTWAGASGQAASLTTSSAAITITAGASSTWQAGTGTLDLRGASGITLRRSSTTLIDVGSTATTSVTLAAGITLSGAAGAGALSLGSMTGNTALPTGNLAWTGANNKTLNITATGVSGFATITSGSQLLLESTSTSDGALMIRSTQTSSGITINGGRGVNVYVNTVLLLDMGFTTSTALTMAAGKSIVAASGASAFNFGSASGAFAFPTGDVTYAGASNKAISLTTTGASGTMTLNLSGGLKLLGTAPSAAADTVGRGVADIDGATTAALKTIYEGGAVLVDRVYGDHQINVLLYGTSLTDQSTIDLGPVPTTGRIGTVTAYANNQYGTATIFPDGTVSTSGSSSGSFDVSDTDGTLCVFVTSGRVKVRNRLGVTYFTRGRYEF